MCQPFNWNVQTAGVNTQYSVNNNTQEVIQLIENIKPPLQCADGGDGAVLLSTVYM